MEPLSLAGVVEAIVRLGFPIATAVALAAWQVYQDRNFRLERAQERDAFLFELRAHREKREAFLGELRTHREELGGKLDQQTRLLERLVGASGRAA